MLENNRWLEELAVIETSAIGLFYVGTGKM
jgi:hypothetical protein